MMLKVNTYTDYTQLSCGSDTLDLLEKADGIELKEKFKLHNEKDLTNVISIASLPDNLSNCR